MNVEIPVVLLEGASLPEYATEGAAGMDLRATEGVTLAPGERAAVPTGLRLEIPEGYEGQVRPRSGLALQHGLGMVNSPGTIDSDYRGELKVILLNLGSAPYAITKGDRIAQMIIARYEGVEIVEGELSETLRGAGGFGSSGR